MKDFITQYPQVEIAVPRMEQKRRWVVACMDFGLDLSELFPYLNAVVQDAHLYENPPYLQFRLDKNPIRLYPHLAVAGPFPGREQAHELIQKLIDLLNDTHCRRETISPDFRVTSNISTLDVLRLLPQTNCGECGFPTCLAFGAHVGRHKASIQTCPHLARPLAFRAVYPVLDSSGKMVSTVELDVDQRNKAGKPSPAFSSAPRALPPSGPENKRQPQASAEPFGEALTGREKEVLRLVAEGFTNKQICLALGISSHTVKSHVDHIFNKLGVSDRTQAAVWAVRHHLL